MTPTWKMRYCDDMSFDYHLVHHWTKQPVGRVENNEAHVHEFSTVARSKYSSCTQFAQQCHLVGAECFSFSKSEIEPSICLTTVKSFSTEFLSTMHGMQFCSKLLIPVLVTEWLVSVIKKVSNHKFHHLSTTTTILDNQAVRGNQN